MEINYFNDTVKNIIVTSGQPFTDIDALACAISYTELLKLESNNAEAILPGLLNKTVTEKVKKWKVEFSTIHHPRPATDYKYVLVDISDPEYFADFVNEKDIIEIFDHRYGYERFWRIKLGKSSHIEMVGACATLIWEEYKKRGFAKEISKLSARLIVTAIISNTLNFKASVTTKRDVKAYKGLKKIAKLPKDWIKVYFSDQDKETHFNIKSALINDTKNLEPIIGQLELWDSKIIVLKYQKEIEEALLSFGRLNWFLTAPSISEGKNYLYTKNPKMKDLLRKTINAKFDGDIGTTDKLWLRKEIFQKTQKLINK